MRLETVEPSLNIDIIDESRLGMIRLHGTVVVGYVIRHVAKSLLSGLKDTVCHLSYYT
jgi:hypothetical protein